MVELVKIVLLGAPAVGKTSIVHQFVWNEFSEEYSSTDRKETYYPAVIINDHLYELKMVDVPVIPYFPVDSLYEWTDFRFYGLRSATAYVLVFDLSSPSDTFQYIKNIREQMYESRDMHNVPVFVAANKQDLASGRDRRDVVNLVKKQWKCGYIECSAKYNWHVVTLFKEVMRALDMIRASSSGHPHTRIPLRTGPVVHAGSSLHHHRNKCIIL